MLTSADGRSPIVKVVGRQNGRLSADNDGQCGMTLTVIMLLPHYNGTCWPNTQATDGLVGLLDIAM